MRDQLFRLSRDSGGSLQSQVREALVDAILGGHIPPGGALPSCRRLARQLGVARNTVVSAYQGLVDEGYLVARERSGYFVADDVLAGHVDHRDRPSATGGAGPRWDDRLRLHPGRHRNVEKRADWQRYPYPFLYGQFDLALFPVAEWRECVRAASRIDAVARWASDGVDRDDPALLEQIHTRLLPRRGVWADADEILVTVGAQHALYLLANLLVGDQTTVAMEDPGYPDARNIFLLHTERLLGIPVDDGGLRLTPELADCDYVHVTPSHQSPTTVTMDLGRRQALLETARRHDLVLIEDDYESEFNFVGEPTPALKSLDRDGRVIYVGSLSKTLAPGLRLGFLVGPRELVRELRALRRLMLRHPPANNQRAAALFLAQGHHDSLVRRLSHAFRERWQAMGEALARHLPDSSRRPTFGGTAYWVEGPPGLDVARLAEAAAAEGILIERGDVFYLCDDRPRSTFRLGFSSIDVDHIEPGIARLAALVRRLTCSSR
ncbi:MAG: PLP-dependent aminotransferase family protein [Ectothiorhodospiraceae bacterium]|nr:PLP-dependent aminotransferase family protein [Chromatiales bacterium]MCP5154557.1 PLP-dependent aminotransferase family protein [Ectothiorhodospiraceae bacterium]